MISAPPIRGRAYREPVASCNSAGYAARIVECVNAHDALVSALQSCVERLGIVIESDTDDALHGASPDDVAAYEAGRAALAVAELRA